MDCGELRFCGTTLVGKKVARAYGLKKSDRLRFSCAGAMVSAEEASVLTMALRSHQGKTMKSDQRERSQRLWGRLLELEKKARTRLEGGLAGNRVCLVAEVSIKSSLQSQCTVALFNDV